MRKLILFLFIGTCVQTSCDINNEHKETSVHELKTDDQVVCDSLFYTAVELIKLDSFSVMDGKFFMRRMFNHYDKETYEKTSVPFLNTFHDSLEITRIIEMKNVDTIFNAKELSQSKLQESKIATDCFSEYSFISKDSVKKWLNQYEQSQDGYFHYYSFSRPLVSASGDYFMIEVDEHCYGLCGSGTTFLFKKENNKWSQLWSFCRWVS